MRVTALPAISPRITEPSAIATGPSGNRNPVAITRRSAIASSSLRSACGFCRRIQPKVKPALPTGFQLAQAAKLASDEHAGNIFGRWMGPMAREYEVAVKPDIVFVEHDGVRLLGDLYLPKGGDRGPVLIAIHGGGWQ